jgi:hypothetical protein
LRAPARQAPAYQRMYQQSGDRFSLFLAAPNVSTAHGHRELPDCGTAGIPGTNA